MSVQWRTYLFKGCKYDYEKIKDIHNFYNKYEDYIVSNWDKEIISKNNISVIFDGMSGHYVMVGVIVERSDMYEGFDDIIDISSIDPIEAENIKLDIEKNFPELDDKQVKNYIFTHYS